MQAKYLLCVCIRNIHCLCAGACLLVTLFVTVNVRVCINPKAHINMALMDTTPAEVSCLCTKGCCDKDICSDKW